MRFDIGWQDLMAALWFCARPSHREAVTKATEDTWSQQDDCVATLSVRSAFDLLLQELAFDPGDEILLSAWTVPGMVQIVEAHGLVPVPVDVDQHGHLIAGSLERAITSRSRMFVVAHLFGSRVPLDHFISILKRKHILLVEDCAQSFDAVGDHGHDESDVVMHSFGPIKTSTALGGAIAKIRSPSLRGGIRRRMQEYPHQSSFMFAKRVVRFGVLKMLSGRLMSSLLDGVLRRLGVNVDAVANSLGKGFDGKNFLKQIRHQPSLPLLKLMRRRFESFEGESIRRRKRLGNVFDQAVGWPVAAADSSRWICPVFVDDPEAICDRLRRQGFDATSRSRMSVVPPPGDFRTAPEAALNWQKIVFLPWYSDLSDGEVRRMAELVRPFLAKEAAAPPKQHAPQKQMLICRR